MSGLRATPFYARTAAENRRNSWENRNGFTFVQTYDDVQMEAVSARFGVAMIDRSWHWRIDISGARAEAFVSCLFTRDVSALTAGDACETLWLNDAGGMRGRGIVVRTDGGFQLVSAASDPVWFARAADLFGVEIRDRTGAEGILALVGPAASRLLAAAGLDVDVVPMTLRRQSWRGLDVALSRLGADYELWCAPDDAAIVWDRLTAAGRPYALRPAGQAAADILDIECGTVCPGRDFAPADDDAAPPPQALGLSGLIDAARAFNGRAGVLAAGAATTLLGLVFDSDSPLPPATPLLRDGRLAGQVLTAVYSPAMRAAVGLGMLPSDLPPQTVLSAAGVACRTVALPILPIPAPIPTESRPRTV